MYRALYRKWRPQVFSDVIGQQATVTALKNQISTGRIGHAYMFTGVRGTGKTTCAKIFAKAINCISPLPNGDPCGCCAICSGIDNGSNLDVVEMDAASNNGVDDIRTLKDETAYTPSTCKFKVYIIDEVHMLSAGAFNALLKTLEEPPSHIVFILATTEIHKVPVTILSRCQRYDFKRIQPDQIADRLTKVAETEKIEISPSAIQLISRLADGAMRDALSILDTCAASQNTITEETVRAMTGTMDKSYLFRISNQAAEHNYAAVLQELASFRQMSDDMKRFCEELIAHYRNLMLASLPDGIRLLNGVSPQDEELYAQNTAVSQADAIRSIRILGKALESLTRSGDPRVELELALFELCTPKQEQAAVVYPSPAAAPVAPAAFQVAPAAAVIGNWAPSAPTEAPAPLSQTEISAASSVPQKKELSRAEAPSRQAATQENALKEPAFPIGEFEPWPRVLEVFSRESAMLFSYLKNSHAFFDGKYVLIDGGSVFRDYIRSDKVTQNYIKEVIFKVCGKRTPIGPYTRPTDTGETAKKTIEEELSRLQNLGTEVVIQDK